MKVIFFTMLLWCQYVSAEPQLVDSPRAGDWFSPCFDGEVFRFVDGFENPVQMFEATDGIRASIQALGTRDCAPSFAKANPENMASGKASLQFDGGSADERSAKVVQDPVDPSNHVLQFKIQHPNVTAAKSLPTKGRVQMNLYGARNIHQVHMAVRMFLPFDFNVVRSYPGKIDWLTISEWWNNAAWTGEKYPFRITVNLIKDQVGENAPLYFQVHAQTLNKASNKWDRTVWTQVNRSFVVPVGRWVTLDYDVVEGDARQGRFRLAATVQGGKKTTIFDVNGYTHHPEDQSPNGLTEFNPIKLYTSDRVIDFVRMHGGTLQLYWDDLKVVQCPSGMDVDNVDCQR